ncbi:hypothetical protein EDD16DRAFT_1707407 [Pisolithus croceorrhizus]|nr:hypothetical protein EV401DRAFT_2073679 [Pisolithus croceorrhizus]KAI6117819.1 hypothetical protein EDD16DRAFT_1707407 [Pisolithus croceorrhizus]KAI6163343.1 hypothetical protein EDD17DRAFT_1756300 [Pisolithus thermaeus]
MARVPRTRRRRQTQPSDDDSEPVPVTEHAENELEPFVNDDNVSEDEIENDENAPINIDESARPLPALSFAPRSSLLRTPMSHHISEDLVLRDITDQFFFPPTPSPIRISKNTLKRPAQSTLEPPRRPKKPKAHAYPADPPNWTHLTQPSSSLPPSSPLPTSDNGRAHGHNSSARYEYELTSTPVRVSDSDPFGFLAIERALKAERAAAVPPVRKSAPRPGASAVKSPPLSMVFLSNTPTAPVRSSSARPQEVIPTNYEDIDDLYLDEPVAGPSSLPLIPSAPLLGQQSAREPIPEPRTTHSQTTFPDPLRTPRKRKRVVSPTPEESSEGGSQPSSPSPVKVSIATTSGPRTSGPVQTRALAENVASTTPVQKHTRAQTAKARGKQPAGKVGNEVAPASKRVKTKTRNYIPTPSSTPSAHQRSVVESSPSSHVATPVRPRRRSARQAAAAKHPMRNSSETERSSGGIGRIRTRLRSARSTADAKSNSPVTRRTTRSGSRAITAVPGKQVKSMRETRSGAKAKEGATTRGRGRGGAVGAKSGKDAKGKRKARPLEDVLGMSDDTRERYDKERRERQEYFKRLEGYQLQKENVYIV